MPKLTKRVIDAAEIQAAEYFIWDDELPGFALRVLPSGRKGYIVQYRAGRRSRRMSLGPSSVLTCEQARTRAIGIIAAARSGDDPAAERLCDTRTGPARERQEHGTRPIRFATITRGSERLQRLLLLFARRHRRFARHAQPPRINARTESQLRFVGQAGGICLGFEGLASEAAGDLVQRFRVEQTDLLLVHEFD